jgi:hypothetical protein
MELNIDFHDLKAELENPLHPKEECKGLFFRGYHSIFWDSKQHKLETKSGLRLLKRKSCKGCEKCGFFLDTINEMMNCGGLIIPEIEDWGTYSIRVTNINKDWETGLVDDYDLEFYEV